MELDASLIRKRAGRNEMIKKNVNCPTNKSFWESRTLFSKRVLAFGEPAGGIRQPGLNETLTEDINR